MQAKAHALIIYSEMKPGFCAGADLRELYQRSQAMEKAEAAKGVRDFLERIHRVLNQIDAAPLTTIAAVHGVTFGGGFELALACDLIIADKMARFCFPELRLGLIPGFGGIPRLKRDLGNAVVRDLLLTGRSINATKAQQIGLVSQVVGEGEALRAARATAAQLGKFDRATAAAAKKFIKPIPREELRREIDIFCELFGRAGGAGWVAEICGEHGCAAVLAVRCVEWRVPRRWRFLLGLSAELQDDKVHL